MQTLNTFEIIITAIATWGVIIVTIVQALGWNEKIKEGKFNKIYSAFEAVVQITYNSKVRQQKLLNVDNKLTDEQRKENMEETLRETRKFLEENHPGVLPIYDLLSDMEKIAMVEKIIRDFKK